MSRYSSGGVSAFSGVTKILTAFRRAAWRTLARSLARSLARGYREIAIDTATGGLSLRRISRNMWAQSSECISIVMRFLFLFSAGRCPALPRGCYNAARTRRRKIGFRRNAARPFCVPAIAAPLRAALRHNIDNGSLIYRGPANKRIFPRCPPDRKMD